MSKILAAFGLGIFGLIVGLPNVIGSFNEYDITADWIVVSSWIIAGAGAAAVLVGIVGLAVRLGIGKTPF